MLEKTNLIKLIAMIVLILVLPSLFFSYIGQEPNKRQDNSSGQIAIVNEDLGAEFQGERVFFGQAVTASIGENSEYNYVVVGRNAAESGLERNQYDGILYLSSDFSNNILTFKEDQPERASLSYQIQPNLNARNIERVQRSLQNARSRINRQVTSIYWDVVAQEVNDIRQKFDNIVEREIAFQEAMYSFYAPNSQTIASEVERQKELLEQLLSSSTDAEATSEEAIANIETYEQQLSAFLENVQAYREYQEQQNELFMTTSLENQQLLEQGLTSYESTMYNGFDTIVRIQERPRPAFTNDGQDFSQSVSRVQGAIDGNYSVLSDLRASTGEETVNQLAGHLEDGQREMMNTFRTQRMSYSFNQLESAMLPIREELTNGSNGGGNEGGQNPPAEVDVDIPTATLASAESLTELKAQLSQLKGAIDSAASDSPSDGEEGEEGSGGQQDHLEGLRASVAALESEIEKIEGELNAQSSTQAEWERVLEELIAQIESTPQQQPNPGNPGNRAIIDKINQKEAGILGSSYLSTSRKDRLAPYFGTAIQTQDTDKLLTYYSHLSAYHEAANQSVEQEDELISDILAGSEGLTAVEETFESIQGGFNDLQSGLDQSIDDLDLLESDFEGFVEAVHTFIDEYDESVQLEQEAIVSELQEIEENANLVTLALREGIETPEVESPPVDDMSGEMIVSNQQNAMGNIEQVSNLVSSLSDRSNYVNEYTDELYEKVGSVQSRADELNNNWATNVEASQLVQNDLYSILRNAVVDGQPNPYVYDYLSNPVQISGEAPEERTNNTPPVVMLVIILVSGLIIGLFVHYFSYVPAMLNASMFVLLNIAVGLIISIYGLNIYPMHDVQAFKWTIVTILLLTATAGLVQLGLVFGLITGGLVIVGLMLFFVTPLLDLVMPNFSMNHPVSEVYMSIQFGNQSMFIPAVIVLSIVSIIAAAAAYFIRGRRLTQKEEEDLDESYEAS
ncbi:type VII secretion protein EsaA [Alkalihalophilus pseudofirmus]|uniref:type VII secretion protein EsaA n=1 Tax=Alkalihalophilus pseudofirmus TaxID=79885 RepID=UPI00259BD4EE|nr:type VII secretion protein EsaA [Alkalihalophilus pseudofirmus]WEG17255.1 type VII secretion protein EsaA [Alkalihalophilus pseudofirmus]